jgi:hypothetical protein
MNKMSIIRNQTKSYIKKKIDRLNKNNSYLTKLTEELAPKETAFLLDQISITTRESKQLLSEVQMLSEKFCSAC